jgi:predicted ATPase
MKLEAFRVQNYKKIRDTGWVECGDLTVLVGKNEAGKSAVLRGLSKLKPTDGARLDPLKEFPHGRFTDEFHREDWPAVTGRFVLDDRDRADLAKICPALSGTGRVTVTRHYSGRTAVVYDPPPPISGFTFKEWRALLEEAVREVEEGTAPDGKGDAWSPKRNELLGILGSCVAAVPTSDSGLSSQMASGLRSAMLGVASEQWMRAIVQPFLTRLDGVAERLKAAEDVSKGGEWVISAMPSFLYFGGYEILRSAIYIPEFVRRLGGDNRTPQTRIQQALFKHVGVEIEKLAPLGQHQPGQGESDATWRGIDELNIRANSASIAMTEKFAKWWQQRRHKISYRFHGDYFRVWVADDLDPSEVELEERSQGMQYFFSFYLLFLVEAGELHRNCILLLDEPGLHLHGTAQAQLIGFLDKLSKDNQLVYTTHSPFMIDGTRLERAKAVYETPNGTCVSGDVWPRDKDTLFPLQAALGYSVCQSLFLSKRQVLVEGITDYMLLSALSNRLRATGRCCLSPDIVMLPAGGTTKLAPLASMLVGHEVELAIVLDGDPAAVTAVKKLRETLPDIDSRCLQISGLGFGPRVKEIEDVIPEDYYLDAVGRAFPGVSLQFTAEEQKLPQTVDRLTRFFNRNGTKFEKWRPVQCIVEDIGYGASRVPDALCSAAETVFAKLNGMFPKRSGN